MEYENYEPTAEELEAERISSEEMEEFSWQMEQAEHQMWRTAASAHIKNGTKPLISL